MVHNDHVHDNKLVARIAILAERSLRWPESAAEEASASVSIHLLPAFGGRTNGIPWPHLCMLPLLPAWSV